MDTFFTQKENTVAKQQCFRYSSPYENFGLAVNVIKQRKRFDGKTEILPVQNTEIAYYFTLFYEQCQGDMSIKLLTRAGIFHAVSEFLL